MARTAPFATAVAVLGDDLLRDIFLLLPTPADLLRAALACKPFLHAVRSAPFLRCFRRRHPLTCPPLLGCFIHRPSEFLRRQNPVPRFLPAPLDAAARRVVDRADFTLSFLPDRGSSGPADPWKISDSRSDRPLLWNRASAELPVADPWKVLDCRNGRLLMRNRLSPELAVADPLTRRWVPLPAPPSESPVGYGLVTDDAYSSLFRAFCISEDGGGGGLRALVLSSTELRWADVAVLAGQYDLADSRAMQANRSLYWKLKGGERMVALDTTTMEFSVLQLPDFSGPYCFDIIEKGEDGAGGLYLLTMLGFCIEVWGGRDDGSGVLSWTRVEKSVKFGKAIAEMTRSKSFYRHGLDVIGVVAGVTFVRNGDHLLSIELETMKLRMVSRNEKCSSALIYPYTIAWPPPFLNPTEHEA